MKLNNRLSWFILLLCAFSFFSQKAYSQSEAEKIKLNQLGFYPFGPKIAVITTKEPLQKFYVIKANSKDTVFSGALGSLMQSAYSVTKTQIADFGKYTKPGSYYIWVPGVGRSYTFNIGENVYQDVAIASIKGYYYQRSSIPLLTKNAGKWARPAGHPDTKVLIHPSAATKERPAGAEISTPGGWYDAGDYNKYIVNCGITMGTLLSAYEETPLPFNKLKSNIPESGNGIPDILNEVIYNLRWMLSMQDPSDGGVYNKCTNADFDGMVMPGVTTKPRYVVQKGTAATLDFAAVMAQASRILSTNPKKQIKLADSCLKAAKKAWQWALLNPALEYNQNQINSQFEPKITTGGYGDRNFSDEWFWAATELFIDTKEKDYYDVILKGVNDRISIPSWGNVFTMGVYSILNHSKLLPEYTVSTTQALKTRFLEYVDGFFAKIPSSAFQTVMGQSQRDFAWGSNAVCANQGVMLMNAYKLTMDRKYVISALSNLDYLLGRNATGYCFVTGFGSKSPMHPHHRQSTADAVIEPVPGLLVGGPNPGRQDGCKYEFTEPETAYLDNMAAYASNEIAINWNAPFVYLSWAIEASKEGAGFVKTAVSEKR
jgi:endoglucanase